MFIGHYSAAFAASAVPKGPPLWVGFVAAQAVDYGFFALVLAGKEHWRPAPDLPGFSPFELVSMPFTHSLVACLAWALVGGLIAFLSAPKDRRWLWTVAIAAVVASHWVLDLLVHRPDLTLIGDEPPKYGFGLWNYPAIAVPLELGVLLVPAVLYLWHTMPKPGTGHVPLVVLAALLLLMQGVNWFGPPPVEEGAQFPILGLVAFTLAVLAAWWVDRNRVHSPERHPA